MTITRIDVPLVAPHVGEEEIDAVAAVMRSGQLAAGPEVDAFERELAAALGVGYAVAMNSGTAANHAALSALDVGPGDEVLTTPFTFAASATPILMRGAIPRFVDIDPATYNLDPASLMAAVTRDSAAAVVVDLFGLPIDPRGLATLRDRGLAIVEDACQAIGARRDGRNAGSLGEAATFSFYATKNVTTGEGGMLVTERPDIAAAARRFRHHGQGDRYEYLSLGYNYRMTDMTAAIGRVQLGRLAEITAARRANAAYYHVELAGLDGVRLPTVPPDAEHAYHQFCLCIDREGTRSGADRDAVRVRLRELGVETGIYYPTPLHLHPLFAAYGYGAGDFPVSERIAREILALPVHPALSREQRAWTAHAVRVAVGAER